MADLQAELARFEAELADVSAAQRPAPGDGLPTGLPPPPPAQAAAQQPAQTWPAASHPPAYPSEGAQPSAAPYAYAAPSYYPPAQAAAGPSYSYASSSRPGLDSSKAELLTGIKAAFEEQTVTKKTKVGVARQAAGKRWIDANLVEWPENDFRIFVGDLGNETNDDVITKAFAKYPTFNKAKVVRDKKSNKTKGFGFVSFSDPIEGAKALREMDGKYIGNRPCKLRKSTWQERSQQAQPFLPGRGGKKKNHIGGVVKKSGILHK